MYVRFEIRRLWIYQLAISTKIEPPIWWLDSIRQWNQNFDIYDYVQGYAMYIMWRSFDWCLWFTNWIFSPCYSPLHMTDSSVLLSLVECVLLDILIITFIVLLFIKHCLSIYNNLIGFLGTKCMSIDIDNVNMWMLFSIVIFRWWFPVSMMFNAGVGVAGFQMRISLYLKSVQWRLYAAHNRSPRAVTGKI